MHILRPNHFTRNSNLSQGHHMDDVTKINATSMNFFQFLVGGSKLECCSLPSMSPIRDRQLKTTNKFHSHSRKTPWSNGGPKLGAPTTPIAKQSKAKES